MKFLKKLFNILFSPFSFLYHSVYLLSYRFYLSCLNIPIYARFPRLTLLDLCYIFEEFLRFVCLPFRLVLSFFTAKSAFSPVYGSITFSGIAKIANSLMLNHYTVCDIGSGKGKLLFYLSIAHKCKGVGIETYTPYVFAHRLYSFFLGLSKTITLHHHHITTKPLPQADVYFVLGLGFDSTTLTYIQEELSSLVSRSIVVSVGVLFPALSSYHRDTLSLPYSWGYCDTYIYHCIDSTDKA